MYTIAEVQEKRRIARRARLSGRELLCATKLVQRACNGIGAEWMSPWLRWTISLLCPTLVIVADLHDLRYELGGTEADRAAADEEFLANGYRMAAWKYSGSLVKRKITENRAKAMYKALRVAGGKAWNYR